MTLSLDNIYEILLRVDGDTLVSALVASPIFERSIDSAFWRTRLENDFPVRDKVKYPSVRSEWIDNQVWRGRVARDFPGLELLKPTRRRYRSQWHDLKKSQPGYLHPFFSPKRCRLDILVNEIRRDKERKGDYGLLIWAIIEASTKQLKHLLESRELDDYIDVEAQSYRTPYCYSIRLEILVRGEVEKMALLVEYGFVKPTDQLAPFFVLVNRRRALEMVKMFLERGFDVMNGRFLNSAIFNNEQDVIDWYTENGIRPVL